MEVMGSVEFPNHFPFYLLIICHILDNHAIFLTDFNYFLYKQTVYKVFHFFFIKMDVELNFVVIIN